MRVPPLLRPLLAVLGLAGGLSCADPTQPAPTPPRPKTVVLFATPKFVGDFAHPAADIGRFLRHYLPLIGRADRTVLIFGVGNTDHILMYRGTPYWSDSVEWARYTNGRPVSDRTLSFTQLAGIVRTIKDSAAALRIPLVVYDQIDPGNEFTRHPWKYERHRECMDWTWESFDVRQRLRADRFVYATAPDGIPEGMNCGVFLVNQANRYLRDLGFDGILYGNQFGTRGRWLPNNGPGYSDEEAQAIREFLAYSRAQYETLELMWFDSYNSIKVERETFSFPGDGYQYFDYMIASGFAVITDHHRYLDNLKSKLHLSPRPKILTTLDYVDPWYTYDSMTDYAEESRELERYAIEFRDRTDGIVFFANDRNGVPVPRDIIVRFARRYFPDSTAPVTPISARLSSR